MIFKRNGERIMRKRQYLLLLSVLFVFFLISATVEAADPSSNGSGGSRGPGGDGPGDDDDDDDGNGGFDGGIIEDDGGGPDCGDGDDDDDADGSDVRNRGDGSGDNDGRPDGGDGDDENTDDSDKAIGIWSMDSMEINGVDYFGRFKRAILAFKSDGIEIDGADYNVKINFDTAALTFKSDDLEMEQQVDDSGRVDTSTLIRFDTATTFIFESDGTYTFNSPRDSSLGTWEIKNDRFYMISSETSGSLFGNRPSDMNYDFSDGDATLTLSYTMILNGNILHDKIFYDKICSIKIVLKKISSEPNSDGNGDGDGNNEGSDGFGRFNNYIEYLRFIKSQGKLYSKNGEYCRYDFNILFIGCLLCSEFNSDSDGESDSDEPISDSNSESDSDEPNSVNSDPNTIPKTNELVPPEKDDAVIVKKDISSESDLKIVQKEESISADNVEDAASDEKAVPTETVDQKDDGVIETNDNSVAESDLVNGAVYNTIMEESEVVPLEKDDVVIVEKCISSESDLKIVQKEESISTDNVKDVSLVRELRVNQLN